MFIAPPVALACSWQQFFLKIKIFWPTLIQLSSMSCLLHPKMRLRHVHGSSPNQCSAFSKSQMHKQLEHRLQVLQFYHFCPALPPSWMVKSGLAGVPQLSDLEIWLDGMFWWNRLTQKLRFLIFEYKWCEELVMPLQLPVKIPNFAAQMYGS